MKARRTILLSLTSVFLTGCLVDIEHTRDPEKAFTTARIEAANGANEDGPAQDLHVLVYDPQTEQLIRMKLPLWVARRMEFKSKAMGDVKLQDLEKAGRGAIIEVEDEGDRVLAWLR